ncbi:MAG: DedA family protein, partial [Gemmatimonadaceae bacterium]|nr:DedA family protein [Acetobacteraceae bacterium]
MTAVTDFIVANIAWALPLAFLVSFAESLALVSVLVPGTA